MIVTVFFEYLDYTYFSSLLVPWQAFMVAEDQAQDLVNVRRTLLVVGSKGEKSAKKLFCHVPLDYSTQPPSREKKEDSVCVSPRSA